MAAEYTVDDSIFNMISNLSIHKVGAAGGFSSTPPTSVILSSLASSAASSPSLQSGLASEHPLAVDENLSATGCSSNISEEYFEFYDTAQYITGLIVYPILCFIGIIGNTLALIVLGHRDMRTSTNVYLSSLAVSDTIKLLNDLMYFIIVAISQTHPGHAERAMSVVYPVAHYVFNMSVCVTAWLTVSVAVERYISVCYPSRAKELCTIVRARFVCTFVFISMSILAVPSGLRYEMKTIYDAALNASCVKTVPTSLGNNDAFMVPYSWIQNSLRGILPVFVLLFLNIRIINELRKERVKGKKFTARNRITLMLIVIVIVFLVCITPDAIMSTFFGKGYVEEDYFFKGIREITDSLIAVNSALSFILYCSMSATFRTTFVKILCPYWESKKSKANSEAIPLNKRVHNSKGVGNGGNGSGGGGGGMAGNGGHGDGCVSVGGGGGGGVCSETKITTDHGTVAFTNGDASGQVEEFV